MTRNYLSLTIVSGALLFGASVSRAQSGNASDNGNQTPAAILSGFYTGGGTVPVPVSGPVAVAISTVSASLQTQALSGALSSPLVGQTITAAAAIAVGQLLSTAGDQVKSEAIAALSSSGASSAAINTLMSELPSLLSNPRPGQIQGALAAFDRLVSTSNGEFLADPPQIFVALHAVLSQISATARAPL